MKVKFENGVAEFHSETDAETEMLIRRFGPGALGVLSETRATDEKIALGAHSLPAAGPRQPLVPQFVAPQLPPEPPPKGVWNSDNVKLLYFKLTPLAQGILDFVAGKGGRATTDAIAAEHKMEAKGLGGSLAKIRKTAEELGLPKPIQSMTVDETTSIVMDKDFRTIVAQLRAEFARELARG